MTQETDKPAERCPKCGSDKIIMFTTDMDACNSCGHQFDAVLSASAPALSAEVKRLKQRDKETGEMILPIIGYMQEEGGGEKWGLVPGDSIFKKVLEILKDNSLAEENKRLREALEHISGLLDGAIDAYSPEEAADIIADCIAEAKAALNKTP